MKTVHWAVAGFVVAIFGALYISVTYNRLSHEEAAAEGLKPDLATLYPIERTFKYSFTVNNPSSRALTDVEFWTYAPVSQTAHQWVESIHSNTEYSSETDVVGNHRVVFQIATLPPYSTKVVDLTVKMRFAGLPVKDVTPSSDVDLEEQRFIEISDPLLKDKASELSAATPTETAKRIFDWVESGIKNEGYVDKDRGAKHALLTGVGDCSEHMYLAAALNRINGIPARGISGFATNRNDVLKPSQLHNWLQVELDGVWRNLDTDRGLFDPETGSYLAIRVLDKRSKFFGDGSQRLYGSGDHFIVEMN